MKFQKYKFRPYNKSYPKLFTKEKTKLIKILPKNTKIEHVGSTAVPGLGGKGIIDITIMTPKKNVKTFIKRLEEAGFECDPDHLKDNERIFLRKIIRYRGRERRVHIHLTLTEEFWNSFILFRDFLKSDKKAMREYAKIKRDGARIAKGDKEKYRKYKESTIRKLFQEALRKSKT